jgi:2-polyprenyl-6-methoxyphenol hydroxylase-like FAD-dependent oxidoreductase
MLELSHQLRVSPLWLTCTFREKRMTMKEKETPRVLIVGAGPTGLMLACQLALRDVPFRIIDKNEDHTTQSRALVVQARSVEIFGQMDLAQEALQLGEKAKAVNVVVNGKQALQMNVREIGEGLTPYPYLLMLEQSKTEQLLNDFLAHRSHTVERQTALLDFTQDAHSVTATIQQTNRQEEVIQVDWLVGADGAHSVVRHNLNIPFAGKTYQQSLFVLDCEVSLHFPSDEMYIAFAERAFAGFFPLTNGRCRVIGTVPESYEGKDAVSFEEVAKDFAQRLHMDVSLRNPDWISLYNSHHRAVSAFRKGRCFLAGDAAHIHSPVGAQGMNTGLQDAYNLAWKLALVSQGRAKEALLATYHDERAPIAHNLVQTTDRAFNVVTSKGPVMKTFRKHVLPLLMQTAGPLAQKQRFIRVLGFKTISQIGIHFHQSGLSQEDPHSSFPHHAPKPGDRVPYLPATEHSVGTQDLVKGTQFHLVLFSGEEPNERAQQIVQKLKEEYPDLIAFHDLHLLAETKALYETFGMKKQGYYFVRPDKHIAYRSASLGTHHFSTYLERFFLRGSTMEAISPLA